MRIRKFASDGNITELVEVCNRFIIDNFEEVIKDEEDNEFYSSISKEEFNNYLSLDDLVIWNEDTTVRAIEKWVKLRGRDNLEELSAHIRVDQLSPECLKKTLNSESSCKELIQTRCVSTFYLDYGLGYVN